ncbi:MULTISPECIES: NAD(P)H-binding protein [unclassified Methylobacterium]|uniref:NAD(P)H-binding protein n=1 Tax=unclassified Methylobacterium TaxID=2615210 RepID=UPI000FBA8D0F|nr:MULTISPECIES: NAD(P)H-binding protein [unclassified Methylobacterium]MDE4911695.1 NAD(P)H-binding protein [Methylobacterium sp. 092160098-2]MDE4914946.1 NAD(P)H-binding protein [Methylobacterium sp. 092160098-2]RUP15848.1 MAG: NAD-dependent epimerase/dehydratase family protein [Methylobacterium sp.]
MTTILIAGATGLVGGLALGLALADSRIDHVVALTRRPVEPHTKLRNVVIDFSDLPADAEWWNVDGVISALGTTRARTPSPDQYLAIDLNYPLAIARLTRSQGATRFALVSSLGADPHSRFAYTRRKGELESELAALAFPSLTIVRPSALDGQRESARLDERLAVAILKSLAPVLPSPWRPSSATAMAELLVEGAVAARPGIAVKTNADVGSCST